MKKRTLITTIALMAALSFAGCGKVNVSRIENGEVTGSYSIPVEELTEYNSDDYYQEEIFRPDFVVLHCAAAP